MVHGKALICCCGFLFFPTKCLTAMICRFEGITPFLNQNPCWICIYGKDITFTPTCEFILIVDLTLRHCWICYWGSSQHHKVTNVVCLLNTSVRNLWLVLAHTFQEITVLRPFNSLCKIQRLNIFSAFLPCP